MGKQREHGVTVGIVGAALAKQGACFNSMMGFVPSNATSALE